MPKPKRSAGVATFTTLREALNTVYARGRKPQSHLVGGIVLTVPTYWVVPSEDLEGLRGMGYEAATSGLFVEIEARTPRREIRDQLSLPDPTPEEQEAICRLGISDDE